MTEEWTSKSKAFKSKEKAFYYCIDLIKKSTYTIEEKIDAIEQLIKTYQNKYSESFYADGFCYCSLTDYDSE